MTTATNSRPATTSWGTNSPRLPAGAAPTTPNREAVTAEVTDFVSQCTKVTIECSWLPNKRTVSKDTKAKMAALVGGKKKRFSGTKTLFNPNLECIQAYTLAKSQFDDVRKKWLINLGRQVKGAEKVETDGGAVYVLRCADIGDFEIDFNNAVRNIYSARDRIIEQLDAVRADAEADLGTEYDKSFYTPETINNIAIAPPDYSAFAVDVRIPTHIQERQLKSLHEQAAATIESGVSRMVDEFSKYFLTAMNQFRRRKTIHPPRSHEMFEWNNAEVVTEFLPQHDPEEIPHGSIKIELRKKSSNDSTTRKFLMTREEYAALNPRETDENRSLRGDVIGDIRQRLEQFERLQGVFGTSGVHLNEAFSQLREVLGQLPEAETDVRNYLRNSRDSGRAIAQTMIETLDDLRSVESRTRRRMRVLVTG
jgi:hypothetical protein